MMIGNSAPVFASPSCINDPPHLRAKVRITVGRLWVSRGPSWCKWFVKEPAGLLLNDFSVHIQLGNSRGSFFFFFHMWNLSAKWSQLKYQLRLELPFSFCWLYPLLLLPDQVSLCLSQTCRHLKASILCFGCVDLCGKVQVPFTFPVSTVLWNAEEKETVLGLWDSSAATVQLETNKSASGTQSVL